MRPKKVIPQEFKKYFWDVEFKEISSKPFGKFALERIMNYGNLKALRWLLVSVPKKDIKKTMSISRELDAKTRNFWRTVYGK